MGAMAATAQLYRRGRRVAYDIVIAPANFGSGGGSGSGGAGGGAVALTVAGTLQVDGQLTANGISAPAATPGRGRSPRAGVAALTVGTLAGAGTISANGGTGDIGTAAARSGRGGAGRIAIVAGANTFTGTHDGVGRIADGFPSSVGAGTIYTVVSRTSRPGAGG